MEIQQTATAQADLDHTWAALIDVTSWPQWTTSMTSVVRLDDGPLRVGSKARVKQPGMPTMIWQVDELRKHEVFTWSAASPGVRTTGVHRIAPNPDGSTEITLEVRQHGPLASLVGRLTGSRTRRYLDLEAGGLKASSESAGT